MPVVQTTKDEGHSTGMQYKSLQYRTYAELRLT